MILAAKPVSGRLTKAILKTADGMHRAGIMDDAAYARITLRHPGRPIGTAEPISGGEDAQEAGQEKTDHG